MAQDDLIYARALTMNGPLNLNDANNSVINSAGPIVLTQNAAFYKASKTDNTTRQSIIGIDGANNTNVQAVVGQSIKLSDGVTNFMQFAASGKMGVTANNDVADYSGATAVRKLGPTSTKLQDNVAATTNNWTDSNGNQVNSGGGKIAASANGAIAHNYAGSLTPTLINTMLSVAGTVIWGTIGNTNATITMSSAGAFVAQALLV